MSVCNRSSTPVKKAFIGVFKKYRIICRNNPLKYTDPSGHHLGGSNGPNNNDDGYDDCGYDQSDNPGYNGPSKEEKKARDSMPKWVLRQRKVLISFFGIFNFSRTDYMFRFVDARGNRWAPNLGSVRYRKNNAQDILDQLLKKAKSYTKEFGHSKGYNDSREMLEYGIRATGIATGYMVWEDSWQVLKATANKIGLKRYPNASLSVNVGSNMAEKGYNLSTFFERTVNGYREDGESLVNRIDQMKEHVNNWYYY